MPSYIDQQHAQRRVSAPPAAPAPAASALADQEENMMDWEAVLAEISDNRETHVNYVDMELDGPGEDADEQLVSLSDKSLLAVLDTNILINHVALLESLLAFLVSAARELSPVPCVLLVPSIVLHELDKLKSSSRLVDAPVDPVDSEASGSSRYADRPRSQRRPQVSLGNVVRHISTWLVEALRDHKAVVRGQRRDETLLEPHKQVPADDRVLDAAAFWQSRQVEAALVTGDKILQAKALSEDIRIVSPKPASDLRTFLAALHPDLLTLYLRDRRPPPPPASRRMSAPPSSSTSNGTAKVSTTAFAAFPAPLSASPKHVSADMAVSTDMESYDMELDVDMEGPTSEMAQPSLDPSLTGISKAYAEVQQHFASLLLSALDKLLPESHLSSALTAADCLEYIDGHWSILLKPPALPSPRRSSSPSISLGGVHKSRWAPAESRAPPPTTSQASAAEAARLRAARDTMASLRATFSRNAPASIAKWWRGRLEAMLDDMRASLDCLEEFGGLEHEVVEAHMETITRTIESAL